MFSRANLNKARNYTERLENSKVHPIKSIYFQTEGGGRWRDRPILWGTQFSFFRTKYFARQKTGQFLFCLLCLCCLIPFLLPFCLSSPLNPFSTPCSSGSCTCFVNFPTPNFSPHKSGGRYSDILRCGGGSDFSFRGEERGKIRHLFPQEGIRNLFLRWGYGGNNTSFPQEGIRHLFLRWG